MSNFTVELETDSDNNIIGGQPNDDLRTGLNNFNKPKNWKDEYSPITDAKVAPLSLSLDKEKQKPIWLLAEIYPRHLGEGEHTSENSALAAEIRSRGIPGDDCGHIIARLLGGKMVDFNLFPQNPDVNRGRKGLTDQWRTKVERSIEIWLTNSSLRNPRVEFEIRFSYDDQQYYPNRPDHGKYLIKFKCDGSEQNKSGHTTKGKLSMALYKELKDILMNPIVSGGASASATNDEPMTPAQASKFHELSIEQFHDFVVSMLDECRSSQQQNDKHTQSSTRHTLLASK